MRAIVRTPSAAARYASSARGAPIRSIRSLRGVSSSYCRSAVDAEVDPCAGCRRSTATTESPAPVNASETSAPVIPAPITTTSQRTSSVSGGGTSPTPLQRSQNAWGEVSSNGLLLPVREPPQCFQPLAMTDARLRHRFTQPVHRLVVDGAVHRVRMSVFATVREAESRRVTHARR